jgi:hypothetical protein
VGENQRVPERRFLILHLNVTNSSAETVSAPGLTLVDDSGQTFNEVVGVDVPAQLGLVRTLKPADTLDGRIVFDVEPKSYKLKLDDGLGKTALVELPLRFDASPSNVLGAPPVR